MRAVLMGEKRVIENVYGSEQLKRLQANVDLYPVPVTRENWSEHREALQSAELIFSTWSMPVWTEAEIAEYMPSLQAVYYAAGSVRFFAKPFIDRHIVVVSGWRANAVPVAQYATAQIMLAAKGYFRVQPLYKTSRDEARQTASKYPGNYAIKIGLLGAGAIGSLVAGLLQPHNLEVLVYDPFLSDEKAKSLQVRKTDLDEIFSTCSVISNHLANLPATQRLLQASHFQRMLPYATFINTGRGAQLDEQALADALLAEPGRTALLDVLIDETHPEQSPLFDRPNCLITPHIAGSSGQEVRRMADFVLDDLERMLSGRPLLYRVTAEMLETMA
ncbi:MAG: hydroxyacid dehydrogenase [Clostridiaceae bacterium]|nr:hydroxyacid dehydrogenase [Clostridiaceae bacterium]